MGTDSSLNTVYKGKESSGCVLVLLLLLVSLLKDDIISEEYKVSPKTLIITAKYACQSDEGKFQPQM